MAKNETRDPSTRGQAVRRVVFVGGLPYTAARMADYRRKRWRTEMAVRVDVNGALASFVGEAGLTERDLAELEPRVAEAHERLAGRQAAGALRFRELPYDKRQARAVLELAREIREEFDTLVVLAVGGAALDARALYAALRPPFTSHRAGSPEQGARLLIADDVDPRTFAAILDEVDPHKTAFNVICESGEIAATLGQFLVVRERLLKVLGAVDYSRHVVITTNAQSGPLRQIVHDEGFRSLAVPAELGEGYEALSAVGLFPAAVAGVDVLELLAGAAAMDERCRAPSLFENPAYLHGAVQFLARTRRDKTVLVMMPDCDGLAGLAEWFARLWARSLAQAQDVERRPARSGQTAVTAAGAGDQRSQLQLCAEGPDDKIVTFVRVRDHGARLEIPQAYSDLEGVGYLGGRTLGELIDLEQRAAEVLLAQRGRLTTTLELPALNPFTLGQLFALLELQTVFAAELHRVDPFRRAAAEEAERLVSALAGRAGFEEKKADVERWTQRRDSRFRI